MHPAPLLDKVMDLLIDTVFVVDADGRYVYVSASCEDLLGYTPEELIGRNMITLVHPDDRQRTLEVVEDIMDGRSQTHFENRYVRKDGSVVDIMWSARWSGPDGLRLAVARDVTPLRHAARVQSAVYRISEATHLADDLPALYRRMHAIIAELLPADNVLVALMDASGETLSFPYAVGEQVEGASAALREGSPIAHVLRTAEPLLTEVPPSSGEDAPATPASEGNWLGAPLVSPLGVMGAIVLRTDGATRYREEHRDLLRFVSSQVATVIERKQAETRLRHLALHDSLTDLPNRTLFLDRLEMALKRARRDGERVGVLYLDVDDFKEVNDGFGHVVGDELLREVARRLRGCVRASDTVGRMGGDEFTIVLPNIADADAGLIVAEKVREALAEPYVIGGRSLEISVSVGVAVYPEDGSDQDRLLRRADAGMYARKAGSART